MSATVVGHTVMALIEVVTELQARVETLETKLAHVAAACDLAPNSYGTPHDAADLAHAIRCALEVK